MKREILYKAIRLDNGEEIFEVKLSDKQVELLKERLKSKK